MNKLKILILTSEYPNPNSSYDTPVVHYFAKEWVNMGFDVRVIHFRSVFPPIFYFFARVLKGIIKKIFKTDFIPFSRLNSRVEYELEGIKIVSQPIFKIFPHFKFFRSTIRKQARIIQNDNLAKNFAPDIIIGHFINPQLPLIVELKNFYPNVKSSLVLHENPKIIYDLFGEKSSHYLNKLDYIGFRFLEMKNTFVSLFGDKENLFICPSGIPENYILNAVPNEKFKNKSLSICFTGMLIPLKNIDVILEAVNLAFPEKDFILNIYGEGMLKEQINLKINELGLNNCVYLKGKVSRDEVQEALKNTDVFVMVSKPEAFGLVYLEAMGKGCVTIGTKGQGIDGVIENSKNGFLCEARNVEDLKKIFLKIKSMSYEEKLLISKNALKTASNLTDRKVAFSYLKKLNIV